MAQKAHNIHDKFVKASFSDATRASAFFEKFLPAKLLQDIDLSTLVVTQESYIQDNLSEHFSDMIFEVKTKADQNVDLVLLFEHKSSPDKHVLLQVGHYIFSHWFKCISNRQNLKLIIPLVYYQGKKKWLPPELTKLFPGIEGSLLDYIPYFRHIFIALNSVSDEFIIEIRDQMMAAAILSQKKGPHILTLTAEIVKILKLLPIKHQEGNFIKQLFVYIVNVSDVPKNELVKALDNIPTQIKEDIMTTYSQIKLEGKIEGKLEGKLEGKIEVVFALHQDGISVAQIAKYTNLKVDDILEILEGKA